MYKQRRTSSLFTLGLSVCVGLCAAVGCATSDADNGDPHEPIPVVDPTPEFESDNVDDHSHTTTDLQTTIARINPEFAAMLRDTGVAADFAREDALYTVFVPAPENFTPALLRVGDEAERRELVSYYVVPGRMTSSELTNLKQVPTVTGRPLDVLTNEDGTFFAVNQARVFRPNVEATNGIVHNLDAMLLPPDHPAAPGLRDESPTSYIRVDLTLANTCGLTQPRAFFAFDSAKLRASAHDSLADLATCLTTGPLAGQRLLIEGYTDPRGTKEYNKTLGKQRASAVKGYLVDKGVNDDQVNLKSHGEKHAHDEMPMYWDFDRRVDISLEEDLDGLKAPARK